MYIFKIIFSKHLLLYILYYYFLTYHITINTYNNIYFNTKRTGDEREKRKPRSNIAKSYRAHLGQFRGQTTLAKADAFSILLNCLQKAESVDSPQTLGKLAQRDPRDDFHFA